MRSVVVMAAVGLLAPVGLVAIPVAAPKVAVNPANAMADAAKAFVASLSAEQKKLALHAFDGPNREQWLFVPQIRTGLPLKKLDEKQKVSVKKLVELALSELGMGKAQTIVALEKVLREIEKDPVKRDPEMYYTWILRNAVRWRDLGLEIRRPSLVAEFHHRQRQGGREQPAIHGRKSG